MVHRLLTLALLALACRTAAAAPAAPAPAADDSAERIEVIKLGYANAYDVAELLSQILPPTVRVAPYGPTNSIVIAGPAKVLENLGLTKKTTTKAGVGEKRSPSSAPTR